MTVPPLGLFSLAAAGMMAASPVTGPCEGRIVQLCTGAGAVHMLVWDEEGRQPSFAGSKACHACTLERKRTDRKARRPA